MTIEALCLASLAVLCGAMFPAFIAAHILEQKGEQ